MKKLLNWNDSYMKLKWIFTISLSLGSAISYSQNSMIEHMYLNPYKLVTSKALGTGLNLETEVSFLSGGRVGLSFNRILSQNNLYYYTDTYFGVYGKVYFDNALYKYGISPYATLGVGQYKLFGEAIDQLLDTDRDVSSVSLNGSLGLNYQFLKRFGVYGEYLIQTAEDSINTAQVGLTVTLF